MPSHMVINSIFFFICLWFICRSCHGHLQTKFICFKKKLSDYLHLSFSCMDIGVTPLLYQSIIVEDLCLIVLFILWSKCLKLCAILHMLFLSAVFCFCTSTSKTYNPISPLYNPQSKNIGNVYFLPGNHKKENSHTCQ